MFMEGKEAVVYILDRNKQRCKTGDGYAETIKRIAKDSDTASGKLKLIQTGYEFKEWW